MAFVNPNILAQIFGREGAINTATPAQQQALITQLASTGAGMTRAAGQPGATFAQALGGGAQGLLQGQITSQQMQMQQQALEQQRREAERRERISKIMGDILTGPRPDFASQVDARLGPAPGAQATPLRTAGRLSARFESGNNPMAVSSGAGDPGGVSFGAQQLSSDAGTMAAFLQSPEGQPFAAHFSGQQPGSPQFTQSFQEVTQGAGPAFQQAQQQFLERTHVTPVLAEAAKAGIPVNNPVVREVLESQAIQHSGQGNLQIINDAMARVGPNADPEEIVNALYAAREPYAVSALQRNGASQDVINGVRNRYRQERQEALSMLGNREVGPELLGGEPAAPPTEAVPLNGYQRRLQQQQGGALAGIPEQTRQLLSLMEPDQAVRALVDMQTSGQELPADVRSALFMAGGDEDLARAIMLRGQQDDGLTTSTQTRLQAVDALMEADPNLTEERARNIIFGRYKVSRDPISGRAQVVDAATGQLVSGVQPEQVEQANVEQAERELISTIVPEGMDISPGMGGSGFLSNIVNTVSDLIGAGVAFPEAEKSIQAVNNLRTQTMTALAQEVAGRPSNFLLEQFQRIAPSPASLLQGDARSKEKLRTTSALIDEKLRMVNDVVNNPGRHSPTTVDQARLNKMQLEALKRQYDTAYENFGTGNRGGTSGGSGVAPGVGEFTRDQQSKEGLPPAPEGVPEDAWQFMTDEERALWLN